MSPMRIIRESLDRAFDLTLDLFESLDEKDYTLKIPDVPSNTFAGQAWCIVGARESYLQALNAGHWSGFSCSVNNPSKLAFQMKLKTTQEEISKFLDSKEILARFEENMLMDLLEHEIQHHGQLIRFVYANRLSFPKSWNDRYTA